MNTASAHEIETFIRSYIERWNAKDAAAVWSQFYRFEDSSPFKSEADLRAHLRDLEAQGFARSELHAVHATLLAPDRAFARIRFTRLTVEGAAMPPGERGAEYELRKFTQGWRITRTRATA